MSLSKSKNGRKVRKNFRFPADLAKWAESYAARKNTSMTQMIIDYLTDLREQASGK
jgi:hypothetical protein